MKYLIESGDYKMNSIKSLKKIASVIRSMYKIVLSKFGVEKDKVKIQTDTKIVELSFLTIDEKYYIFIILNKLESGSFINPRIHYKIGIRISKMGKDSIDSKYIHKERDLVSVYGEHMEDGIPSNFESQLSDLIGEELSNLKEKEKEDELYSRFFGSMSLEDIQDIFDDLDDLVEGLEIFKLIDDSTKNDRGYFIRSKKKIPLLCGSDNLWACPTDNSVSILTELNLINGRIKKLFNAKLEYRMYNSKLDMCVKPIK